MLNVSLRVFEIERMDNMSFPVIVGTIVGIAIGYLVSLLCEEAKAK